MTAQGTEDLTRERNRRERLQAAPIGQEAVRVYLLACELRDTLEDFVKCYPDRRATATDAAVALRGTGRYSGSWCADHLDALPDERHG